ncbi:competence type IV pilus minor pilin ComGG [Vagococcus coleopterorum]|uniref:competence type IV pilus minor pilin ComGG n=1 Tax=Vagococcus coleopterorum TaxID=2714946 RepID=UPI001EEBDE00|nr:competence type IV pilus minor pilin ComGG [Vagococcus coleopterorum]
MQHFMVGDVNKWSGIIFPSVLVLLMILSGLFYLELNLHKKEQELSILTKRMYEGKVIADMAYQKVAHLHQSSKKDEGVLQYNVGNVKYRVQDEEVRMSIYIDGYLMYDVKEKLPNKKSHSLK